MSHREKHIHDEKRQKVRAALEKAKNEKEGTLEEPRTMLDRFKYKEAWINIRLFKFSVLTFYEDRGKVIYWFTILWHNPF